MNAILQDVVAKDHADLFARGERLCQPQRVCDPSFSFLVGEAQLLQTKVLPVAQQAQKLSRVVAARHDQDLLDSRVYQCL